MTSSGSEPRPTAVRALLDESAEDLYENAPCGYLSTFPDGTIAKANLTFLRWTGYSAEELTGSRRFQDLLTPGGRIYHETHLRPMLHMQGRVREIAVDIVRADGSILPALINSAVRTDPDGRPVVVRTTVFDATERRQYERELLYARKQAEQSEARARLLAHTLQASFIPPATPQIPTLDVAAVYRPAGRGDEVGGDFYDVFEARGGDWVIVIGDVCGKGAEAAQVTALARYTVRAAAMRTRRSRSVLGELNEAMLAQRVERYLTAAYARIRNARAGLTKVTISIGGHPPPLHVDAGGTVRPVGRPGHLLGVLPSPTLFDETIELGPGDLLAFYTDGITEARSDEGFFGEERLTEMLVRHRHRDADSIVHEIADAVVAMQGGLPRDDIAIVLLKQPSVVDD